VEDQALVRVWELLGRLYTVLRDASGHHYGFTIFPTHLLEK